MRPHQVRRLPLALLLLALGLAACEHGGPTDVEDPEGWLVVEAGGQHACGLWSDGQAYCWGADRAGELGDDDSDTTAVATPTPVATDARFESLTVGDQHSCGLTKDGVAHCWGYGELGQLGRGAIELTGAPGPVAGSFYFTEIDAGVYHTCAIDGEGNAHCWGGGGVTGDGRDLALGFEPPDVCPEPGGGYWSDRCSLTPRPVSGGHRFASISAGLFHTCGRARTDETLCWGWNRSMLGNGEDSRAPGSTDPIGYATPQSLAGSVDVRSFVAGSVHTCGLDGSGAAFCWGGLGWNNFGQIGDGATETRLIPTPVTGGLSFEAIVVAEENNLHALNSCGLVESGEAYCWGANREGQLGGPSAEVCTSNDVPCSTTPQAVAGGIAFEKISIGQEFVCGTTEDREAYCWGLNSDGQLGNGTRTSTSTPTRVADPT